MGRLVKGVWRDEWYDTEASNGEFIREDAGFRDGIKNEPSARFQPESGRYHLYVSLACPWAHRTLIFRELKDLTTHIDSHSRRLHDNYFNRRVDALIIFTEKGNSQLLSLEKNLYL